MNSRKKIKLLSLVVTSAMLLAACSDNDTDPVQPVPVPTPTSVDVTYEVTVTNLTNAQPLSPLGVIIHDEGHLWTIGETASLALETMAEGGDNSQLLALPVGLANASGMAPIGPGNSDTVSITIQDRVDSYISVATMLVNTNDAFTGLDKYNLAELAVGDSQTWRFAALDAGTEENSEAMSTIPGPADGGEGFNASREARDIVTYHAGVVTNADGLDTSVLDASHKFDNPVIRLTVTRIE